MVVSKPSTALARAAEKGTRARPTTEPEDHHPVRRAGCAALAAAKIPKRVGPVIRCVLRDKQNARHFDIAEVGPWPLPEPLAKNIGDAVGLGDGDPVVVVHRDGQPARAFVAEEFFDDDLRTDGKASWASVKTAAENTIA